MISTAAVRLRGGESKEFEVKVGVHQGSILSSLLFTIVLEALSSVFREGLPWELLYADDLVVMAESEEELLERVRTWKEGMEAKGLRVNMGKTKIMKCHDKSGQMEDSGKFPCGVCRKGVGNNSILCVTCNKWVHKRCSGVSGVLHSVVQFCCPKCEALKHNQTVAEVPERKDLVLGQFSGLERVDKFCYLGDMIGSGGGAAEAAQTRVKCAWGKFRELSPILVSRGVSRRLKGKIYRACVQSVMTYGSETWAMKAEDMQRLERTENMMVRWMCGVTLKNRRPSAELRKSLGTESISDLVV